MWIGVPKKKTNSQRQKHRWFVSPCFGDPTQASISSCPASRGNPVSSQLRTQRSVPCVWVFRRNWVDHVPSHHWIPKHLCHNLTSLASGGLDLPLQLEHHEWVQRLLVLLHQDPWWALSNLLWSVAMVHGSPMPSSHGQRCLSLESPCGAVLCYILMSNLFELHLHSTAPHHKLMVARVPYVPRTLLVLNRE